MRKKRERSENNKIKWIIKKENQDLRCGQAALDDSCSSGHFFVGVHASVWLTLGLAARYGGLKCSWLLREQGWCRDAPAPNGVGTGVPCSDTGRPLMLLPILHGTAGLGATMGQALIWP